MISDQKPHSVVNELFIRGSKLNISFVFITQTHFPMPKEIRLSISTLLYYEITNRQQFQQIVFYHSLDIRFGEFMKLYKLYCKSIFLFRL